MTNVNATILSQKQGLTILICVVKNDIQTDMFGMILKWMMFDRVKAYFSLWQGDF